MKRGDLDDLEAFAKVAKTRSFTRAAAEIGLSPSALSHAMRGLEDRLGVRLLARTTRSVAPTAAGERLLRSLDLAFAEVAQGRYVSRPSTTRHARFWRQGYRPFCWSTPTCRWK